MKKTTWRAAVGAVSLILSLWPAASWSEFKITPSVSVREEYNDNIYLTRSRREEDFITTITPAINLRYKSNLLDLSLDYGLNFRFYANNSKEDETNLNQTQRAKLDNTFSYRDIVFLKVSDTYARVPIETRKQVGIDNFIPNMTDSNDLVINPYIKYPLGGTTWLNAGYRYQNLWYKEKEGDDYDSHIFNAGLTKELTSKISTFVSYDYEMRRAEVSEDYDRQSANVGLNYQITPKLSVNGSMGRTWFDYDERKDLNSNIWDARAKYQLTPSISLSVGHSLGFTNSVNLGTYKTERTDGSIHYAGQIPLDLTVFQSTGKYNEIARKDETTGVTVGAGLPISPRLNARLTGTLATSEHSVPDEAVTKEDIDRYSVGLSLAYEMKITTLSIGYTWNWNDSTINNNDYKNNIVWVQARFAF